MLTPIAQIVRGIATTRLYQIDIWPHDYPPTDHDIDVALRVLAEEIAISTECPVYYVRSAAFGMFPTIVVVDS